MLNLWPSLSTFIVGLVVLILWRLLGGRTTLGFSRTLLAFSWGAAGATIINIAAQRFVIIFIPIGVVAWTFGPLLEEAAKAAPVLLLAYAFPANRRLTIADYVLTGIASGLGFAIIEGNFFTVLEGKYSGDWLAWFGIPARFSFENVTYWTAGHALWTGFVALGIGAGIRLWPNSPRKYLPAAAAATLSLFEHVMINWKGTHTDTLFGQIESIARAPDWIEFLYSIDMHGFLIIVLLPTMLLVATVIEGEWSRELQPEGLMLPDEGVRPWALREWLVLARIVPRGRMAFFRTTAYFRRRRELGLARAELRRSPTRVSTAPVANYLAQRVLHLRDELDVPMPARWLPAPGEFLSAVSSMLRGRWIIYSGLALFAVIGMLPPGIWPEWLRAFLFGRVFNVLLLAAAVLLLVFRIRTFRRNPRPDVERSDDEALATWSLRGMLLGSSAISLGYAAIAAFLPARLLTGGTVFISNAWDNWLAHGGGPTTLALGGLLASAIADPTETDPCAQLRREAEQGDARIHELEKLAGNWTPPQPPPGGWPLDRQPTDPSTSGMSTDSIFGRALDALSKTGAGKQFMTICQPILGPGGKIIGYAMGQVPVPDNGAGGTPPAGSDKTGGSGISPGTSSNPGILPANNPGASGNGPICQPIFGPNGQIIGYAMGQGGGPTTIPSGDMPTASGGTPDSGTIYLPGGRRLHIDPFEEWLTGKSTVQQALADERELQKQRLAALAGCDQMKAPQTQEKAATTPPPPTHPDFAALQKEIDDAKKQFEELEKKLREAASNSIQSMNDLLQHYDAQWKQAMKHLDAYLDRYKDQIIPDYKKILDQFASRQQALKYAAFADEVYQALAMTLGPEFLPGGALAAGEAGAAAKVESALSAEGALVRAEAGVDSEAAALAKSEAGSVEAGAAESGAAAKTATGETNAAKAASEAETGGQAAKAEADAAAQSAAAQRAQLQQELDNATRIRDPLLKDGVMQDEVQKAVQSGAANKRELFFFGDDTNGLAATNGARSWPKGDDGWLVSLHGMEGGDRFGIYTKVGDSMHYVEVTPTELAQMMRDSGYVNGQPVKLISCWSGSGGQPAAQQLAKELGAEVTAPRGAITMASDGSIVSVRGVAEGESRFVTYGADGSVIR